MTHTHIFRSTNESLEAIVKGMRLTRKDNVLAVCGSGDQAFAMLEYANSVVAVDRNKEQIEYAKERARLIEAGDIDGLINEAERVCKMTTPDYIKLYFSQPGRFERIREKICRLEIKQVNDILDEVKKGEFSKAYISNIIGFNGFMAEPAKQAEYIKRLAGMLRRPGIIYISNARSICTRKICNQHNLQKDKALSEAARKEEVENGCYWHPAVYRRRA